MTDVLSSLVGSTATSTLGSATTLVGSVWPVTFFAPTYSSRKWSFVILATVLFLVLSPGFILTLPQNNANYCANELGIGDCNVASPNSSGPDCKKCMRYWASSFTSSTAVWIHGLVFFSLLFILSIVAIRG